MPFTKHLQHQQVKTQEAHRALNHGMHETCAAARAWLVVPNKLKDVAMLVTNPGEPGRSTSLGATHYICLPGA